MLLYFIPDAVDKRYFILNKILVSQRVHQLANLSITSHCENSRPLSDFIFTLAKVVIELFNELLALLQSFQVALSARVTLILKHFPAFIAAGHCHLKPSPFDFSFVNETCFFIHSKYWLAIHLLIFKLLQFGLNYLNLALEHLPPAIF
jgi:hypothetical protein